MKAIETVYNGYKFRSRLEARWAVFFDSVGIKYQYEPEGFVLRDGTRYLPDFYLPDVYLRHGGKGLYVEVKGVIDERAERTITSLWNNNYLDDSRWNYREEDFLPVLIVGNIPKDIDEITETCDGIFYDFGLIDGDHTYCAWLSKTPNNHFYIIGWDNSFPEDEGSLEPIYWWESNEMKEGLKKARQARFEFEGVHE